jgi:crotonobetainyl-CoA:carnitine CoA-transferase CaiB-like acyl-CoA transferase
MLGEHTEDILKEMGYSDSAIAELLSSGAAVQYQGR